MDIQILGILIGCVTGVISIILHAVSFWKSRFKLEIEENEDSTCYFPNSTKQIDSQLNCFIELNISNQSTLPLTIFDIYLIINGKKYSSQILKDTKLPIPSTPNNSYQIIPLYNHKPFPITLNMKCGAILQLFYALPDLKFKENKDFTIFIKTNRKSKTKTINIPLRESLFKKDIKDDEAYNEYESFINYGK